MPRQKREEDVESDSDYEESSQIKEEESEEEEENEDDSPEPSTASNDNKIKSDEPVAISRRVKKTRRKIFDTTPEEDQMPSYARKTTKGGYAHTNRSKMAISKANAGNTPWNKGRIRSSADKAKIAAGVRARNRAILLEKLKRLGMSEEEYLLKKKEIKYLRERVRRAKAANAKHKASEAELKLKAAIEATEDKASPKESQKGQTDRKELKSNKDGDNDDDEPDGRQDEENNDPGKNVFSRDIAWSKFSFGDGNGQSYDQVCPQGGPGGLICCDSCCKQYSSYLSKTVKDMEIQRTHKGGKEVKELLKFLHQGKKTLERAIGVAKKKVPPLPPLGISPKEQQTTQRKPDLPSVEWNLTSTIDVGHTGGDVFSV